jgi:RecB family exonuclease
MNDLTNSTLPGKVVFLEGSEDADLEVEYQRLIKEAAIEESALQLPKGYLSVSQIEQYRRCPRQFEFRVIRQMIQPPSCAQAEGSALHHGVAAGQTEAVKVEKVALDIMLDAHNEYWKQAKKDVNWSLENEDADNEDTILRRGRHFLTTYGSTYLPYLKTCVDAQGPMVERRFLMPMTSQHIPVMGYIDLIAKNCLPDGPQEPEIIDHKTVSRAKTQEDINQDLQLSVYARAMGILRTRFLCFVKNKTPLLKTVSAIRTGQDLRWAEYVIQSVAQSISRGNFPPGASGWWCGPKFCGFFADCRKGA